MNQDIENIIKKNFYKEFKGEIIESFRGVRYTDGSIDEPYTRNIDKELSDIVIPLIADEVLKVVLEKIEKELEKESKYGDTERYNAFEYILELLSNLSPNKENKNNG